MEKDKLKKHFHFLLNKINNICIAASSNKRIIQESNPDALSTEELKATVDRLVEVLSRIEENARALNDSLQELYKSLGKEG